MGIGAINTVYSILGAAGLTGGAFNTGIPYWRATVFDSERFAEFFDSEHIDSSLYDAYNDIENFQCHRTLSMKAVNEMDSNCTDKVKKFKALADETRLQIVERLTDGELCACKILEMFSITQPTLSYHMKILSECGLVSSRREGAWIRYTLNKDGFESVCKYIKGVCQSIHAAN